jgi:hypothetical protein
MKVRIGQCLRCGFCCLGPTDDRFKPCPDLIYEINSKLAVCLKHIDGTKSVRCREYPLESDEADMHYYCGYRFIKE